MFARKRPRASTRSGTAEAGKTGFASVSVRCSPTLSRGSRRASPHGAIRRRRADHQARRGEDSLDMRALDRPVDFVGEAEVVGRDDQIFQCAVSCRSRKKRKNSTPSRRRRFITSELLTISPMIEAILPGRK